MSEHDVDRPDPPTRGIQHGVVVDNADPLRIMRVRVRIPGLIDDRSGWALPAAVPGGGEAGLGWYAAPPIGAEVYVWALQGDIDTLTYAPGHWGAPGGSPQSPSFVRDLSPTDAVQVRGFETPRFTMVFDDRGGRESFEIRDKVSGDRIVMDGTTRSIEISSTTALRIKSLGAISIDGTAVTINNRAVLPTGRPI